MNILFIFGLGAKFWESKNRRRGYNYENSNRPHEGFFHALNFDDLFKKKKNNQTF